VRAELGPEGVDKIAVPMEDTADSQNLPAYNREYRPSTRLIGIALGQRAGAAAAFTKVFGAEPPLPSSVITDSSGHVLATQPSVPGISALRKIMRRVP
jgi:hypothetical protein